VLRHPFSADQTFSAELVKKHFGPKLNARSMGLIRATFSHSSIRKRHFAVDDPARIMDESPDQQIEGLKTNDIKYWAFHTGGEKIINAVRNEIVIPEERFRATREILAQYGNMSSPTVWFVLDEILQKGVSAEEWCIMVAFGAGLSAHACLLRKM
jgi:3-oxoacyl-[acyl-carrier-protein] synthase III